MAQSDLNRQSDGVDPEALPFVAPCRQLSYADPLRWLREGWRDFTAAPAISFAYGGALFAVSWVVALTTWRVGGYWLILAVLSGFVFIAPALAIVLYSISSQIERGLKPRFGYCVREGRRHLGNEMIFAMVLLVILLLWARAGSVVNIFFPMEAQPLLSDLALFLAVGSAVGAVFAAAVFSASAFSLPMMLDRKVDAVTAVVTSVNAVLRNKGPMALWAAIIVGCVALGFATAFIGLAVLMPVIGYATWHAYRGTIQADAWPVNDAPEPPADRAR